MIAKFNTINVSDRATGSFVCGIAILFATTLCLLWAAAPQSRAEDRDIPQSDPRLQKLYEAAAKRWEM